MKDKISIRIDNETIEILDKLKKELKISKSDIIRMSINHFYNYTKKVNK